MAGLCYDTQAGEAMPFPVAMPDNPLRALSEDLYQEQLPSQPLGERLRKNICLREAFVQEKRPLQSLFGCTQVRDGMDSTVSGNGRVDLMQAERGTPCRPPAPS